jgi:hypothetical protein
MIVTRKCLSRRTVLRGIGTTLALPVLDAMVPALTALGRTGARAPVRFAIVYVPNGVVMEQWTPSVDGTAFELPPVLQPLKAFRERVVIVSGLDNAGAIARTGFTTAGHAQPGASWSTGAEAVRTVGSGSIQLGVSVDQVAARVLGQHLPIPSLEVGIEGADTVDGVASCDPGFSCTYQNTISWRDAKTPLPMEANPRAVFHRLFGDVGSTDAAARRAHMQQQRSILDSVTDKVARLKRQIAPDDRHTLDQYLASVREVERRIQNAEAQGERELPVLTQPSGIPVAYDDHVRLMCDLQVLAYQCDMTRVATFQIGREHSGMTFPQIGVPDAHHPLSHHGTDAGKIAKLAKINTHHVTLLAYYLDKLRSTPDGDGSLLDHVLVLYGSGLSDGNTHDFHNVPILLAGGGGGLRGGRHLRYPKGSRLSDLDLTLLRNIGVSIDAFGDSTGELAGVF